MKDYGELLNIDGESTEWNWEYFLWNRIELMAYLFTVIKDEFFEFVHPEERPNGFEFDLRIG